MRHRVAIVTWDDAFIDTDDFDLKDAKKTKGVKRHTVGWLIHKNKRGVVLATDYYQKKKEGFNAKMFIPWGWVTDLYILEESE